MPKQAPHPGWSHLHDEDGGGSTAAAPSPEQSLPADQPGSAPVGPAGYAPQPSDGWVNPAPPNPAGAPMSQNPQQPQGQPQQQPMGQPPAGQPQMGQQQMGQQQMGQQQMGQQQQGQQQMGQQQPGQQQMGQPGPAQVGASGEQVLFEGVRRHSSSWWDYTLWILVMAAAGTAGGFAQRIEFFSEWPMWLLGFVGLPGILMAYLRHITTKYKISTRRVEFERGVISKDVDSLELWRVLDVRYNQNLMDRILGNATVTLIGTDQSDPELHMHGLPNHRALFEKLRDAVQAARSRGRPMEFVGSEGFGEDAGFMG